MKLTKEWVENELKHSEAPENHRPPMKNTLFTAPCGTVTWNMCRKTVLPECSATPPAWGLDQRSAAKSKISFCYHSGPCDAVLHYRRYGG